MSLFGFLPPPKVLNPELSSLEKDKTKETPPAEQISASNPNHLNQNPNPPIISHPEPEPLGQSAKIPVPAPTVSLQDDYMGINGSSSLEIKKSEQIPVKPVVEQVIEESLDPNPPVASSSSSSSLLSSLSSLSSSSSAAAAIPSATSAPPVALSAFLPTTLNWSASTRLLATHRRPAPKPSKPSKPSLPSTVTLTSSLSSSTSSSSTSAPFGQVDPAAMSEIIGQESQQLDGPSKATGTFAPIFDGPVNYRNEYDPMFPNDYGELLKERARKRKLREQQEEDERRKQREAEEEERRKKREKRKESESSEDKGSVAEKMMLKMGWKGKGLGRAEQGMSTPLTVEKTGTNQGYIRPEAVALYQPTAQDLMPVVAQPPVAVPPSTVILLRNMVGPGEVDDSLQEETAEECTKFGKVAKCLVFEVPGKKVPDDQAVRIFVQFVDRESASRALQALNGRFFAKRMVRATYYDESRFKKLDLAPRADEL